MITELRIRVSPQDVELSVDGAAITLPHKDVKTAFLLMRKLMRSQLGLDLFRAWTEGEEQ